jgi:hypothetical protein
MGVGVATNPGSTVSLLDAQVLSASSTSAKAIALVARRVAMSSREVEMVKGVMLKRSLDEVLPSTSPPKAVHVPACLLKIGTGQYPIEQETSGTVPPEL